MNKSRLLGAVCACAFALITGTTKAALIVEYGAGATGSSFSAEPGQSVMTAAGGLGWDNITFNWFDSSTGAALADGNVFLFGSEYLGKPEGLSAATPGLLGIGVDTGSEYTFTASLLLSPGTQYFFYADNLPGGSGGSTVIGGNGYAGGSFYSPGGSGNFNLRTSPDAAFSLKGTAVSAVSVPAAVWLFGSGLIGLVGVAGRKKYKDQSV